MKPYTIRYNKQNDTFEVWVDFEVISTISGFYLDKTAEAWLWNKEEVLEGLANSMYKEWKRKPK